VRVECKQYATPLVLPKQAAVSYFTPLRVPNTQFHRVEHGLGTAEVAPFSKSVVNVVSGLCERVYYIDAQGTTKPGCVRSMEDLMSDVDRLVGIIGDASRVTGEEFISTRTGSKRRMYQQARLDLGNRPTTLAALARLSFFTKFENTLWTKPQVPRIISPRSFGYNYLLGRYMRPIEHRVFDALRDLGYEDRVIAKGLTQEQKAQLVVNKLRPGWACVGLDASRFDQCVGKELLLAEHAVYNGVFKSRQLAALLRCQLKNVGVAVCYDGKVKADIGPMRCSGDQNTSLGNCLVSVLLARLCIRELGVTQHDILCDGDDLLLFVPSVCLPMLDGLSAWYLKWGMRMKIEQPAYLPEQVEFCQSKPVCVNGKWLLVRKPAKVLNTDFAHGPRVVTPKQFAVHLRAVGLCGMSMAGGVPILQALYCKAIALGRTGKWNKAELAGLGYQARIQWAGGANGKAQPVTECTRESFRLAFGIEPAEQLMLEGWLSGAGPTCRSDVLDTLCNFSWNNDLPLELKGHN